MSIPLSNALNCLVYDVPPYTDNTSRLTALAIGIITEQICSANSLVGVRIKAVGRCGSALLHLEINGKLNASVFPDPVGALQQISFPFIPSGIASF